MKFELQGVVTAITTESDEIARSQDGNRRFQIRSMADVVIRCDRQTYAAQIPVPYQSIKPGQAVRITIDTKQKRDIH